MKKLISTLAVALILVPSITLGNFFSGYDYLSLTSEAARIAYVRGVQDGYVAGIASAGGKDVRLAPDGVTVDQIVVIFEKYLKDTPEKLHSPAVVLINEAVKKAFPQKQ